MAKYVVDSASLTSVADAIREKTGKTGTLTLDQMAEEISGISQGNPDENLELLVRRELTDEYTNNNLVQIYKAYSFTEQKFVTVSMPNLEEIRSYGAFSQCKQLKNANFPKLNQIWGRAFSFSSALEKLDFPLLTQIRGDGNFRNCTSLTALIIRSSNVCTLTDADNFLSTPIASGTGYIYVPAALADSYRSATNWATYSSQIRAIEDYPEITGG